MIYQSIDNLFFNNGKKKKKKKKKKYIYIYIYILKVVKNLK